MNSPDNLQAILNTYGLTVTQCSIMFCLDRQYSKPMSIPKIAQKLLVDRTTARRAIKGRGKDYPLKKSLLGMEYVTEIKTGRSAEYVISEKGRQIVGKIRPVMNQIAGVSDDRITESY